MMNEVSVLVIGVSLGFFGGFVLCLWARDKDDEADGKEAEEIRAPLKAVSETDMLRVAGMSEDDPCVRVPAHIAQGMVAAKEEAVAQMMAVVTPKDEGFDRAMWLAAGYVKACREFQRLWAELRERGEREVREF